MSIGILYESDEWSSHILGDYIKSMGVEAKLINLQKGYSTDELLGCELVVSRIFASAVFRGHQKALERMPDVIDFLEHNKIPMINPPAAHYYEISKELSTKTLEQHGFPVPRVFGVFSPLELLAADTAKLDEIEYPCIIKPNCGGRTHYTYIVNNPQQLIAYLQNVPDMKFIVEEYIFPEYAYITRIEVIDNCCKLILKRSVADNGLSAYHLGSSYSPYPECSNAIKKTALRAMQLLQIEAGSMDIIENAGGFYIIDVNSVSNASEDNIEMFTFDLMKETAAYAVQKYKELVGEYDCAVSTEENCPGLTGLGGEETCK